MITFYLRRRSDGEIVNAVAATTRLAAEEIHSHYPIEDYFLDSEPPRRALEGYRYWHERP